ncbi:hypothetical protein PHMEG_000699 [Phytophthora megakarya]|uniref:Reverse transcriptase domain-containing protein n=1 Tax=Phytophthora megakarya TaxID=4795 RepID=A0A225X3L8_9STRA|nr:hypothetical protein PHMEG_000699 [Phytophthora megakarya]
MHEDSVAKTAFTCKYGPYEWLVMPFGLCNAVPAFFNKGFLTHLIAFLGHTVTPSGILPNPAKVKAVMNMQQPRDLHEIRSFLGLASYFRRYIPDMRPYWPLWNG